MLINLFIDGPYGHNMVVDGPLGPNKINYYETKLVCLFDSFKMDGWMVDSGVLYHTTHIFVLLPEL